MDKLLYFLETGLILVSIISPKLFTHWTDMIPAALCKNLAHPDLDSNLLWTFLILDWESAGEHKLSSKFRKFETLDRVLLVV